MFCFTEKNSYFFFPQSQSSRSLKLLFANCSNEVDVVSRSCLSELLSRTIYEPTFLLYAAPRCLAIVAASQWPRELRLLKSCVNNRVAQVRKDIPQVRTSITVFSQATSGSLGAV